MLHGERASDRPPCPSPPEGRPKEIARPQPRHYITVLQDKPSHDTKKCAEEWPVLLLLKSHQHSLVSQLGHTNSVSGALMARLRMHFLNRPLNQLRLNLPCTAQITVNILRRTHLLGFLPVTTDMPYLPKPVNWILFAYKKIHWSRIFWKWNSS